MEVVQPSGIEGCVVDVVFLATAPKLSSVCVCLSGTVVQGISLFDIPRDPPCAGRHRVHCLHVLEAVPNSDSQGEASVRQLER